ncbi:hypothetical protein PINS_up011082 [Pythium insidiosum]|nr:hypothetical protein PINS_up011082 [Pythium insidiosum]
MSSVHDSDSFVSSPYEPSDDDDLRQRRQRQHRRSRLPSHTALARDLVLGPERRRSSPAVQRSVRVHPLAVRQSDAPRPQPRRATAPPPAALHGALPSSSDRLKHLQIHMEQLQQLYAEEVHMEEMAAREAFVQSLCTAGVTLLRYCASRATFFTAVKALVTQYLPASDARLFQVEWAGDDASEMALVQHDDSVVAVRETNRAMGIAGRSAFETARLRAEDWQRIRANAASSRSEDSRASLLETVDPNDSIRRRSSWLDRHLDCAVPLGSSHLLFAFPLDVAHRTAGFASGIDLSYNPKPRNTNADPELVVVVVCDDRSSERRRPVAVLEALCSAHKSPLHVEFLDAFASLLAAAMQTRASVCRPVTSSVEICVVEGKDLGSDTNRPLPPTLSIDLEADARLVVFGDRFVNAEQDNALLLHLRDPLRPLITDRRRWQQKYEAENRVLIGLRDFRSTLTANVAAADQNNSLRSGVRRAIASLSAALAHFSLRVLFDDESLIEFEQQYSDDTSAPLSVEAQYAALHRAIDRNERFSTSSDVVAVPVPSLSSDDERSDSRAIASVLLLQLLLLQPDGTKTEPAVDVDTLQDTLLPIIQSELSVVLAVESHRELLRLSQDELVRLEERLDHADQRGTQQQALLDLVAQLSLSCRTTTELVRSLNTLESSSPLLSAQGVLALKLFAVDEADREQLQTVWTVEPEDGRVVLFEQTSSNSAPTRGIALAVLQQAAPLVYTPEHPSFDRSWRGPRSSTHQWFVAVPLMVDAEVSPIGVLEVSLENADARDRFLESPLCGELCKVVVASLVALQRPQRALADAEARRMTERQAHDATWQQWSLFVGALVEASGSCDLSGWRDSVLEKMKPLLPTVDVVDLVVTIDESDDREDTTLARRILQESSVRPTSETFNVRHGAVFGSLDAVALGDGNVGVLVAARKRANAPLSAEERRRLELCGALVSWSSVMTRQQRRLERELDARMETNTRAETHLLSLEETNRAMGREVWADRAIARLWMTAVDDDAQATASSMVETLSMIVGTLENEDWSVVFFWCEDAASDGWWQVDATGSRRKRDDGSLRRLVDGDAVLISEGKDDGDHETIRQLCSESIDPCARVVTSSLSLQDGGAIVLVVLAPQSSTATGYLSASGVSRLALAVSTFLRSQARVRDQRERIQRLVVERERAMESERQWRHERSTWLSRMMTLAPASQDPDAFRRDVAACVYHRLETRTSLQSLTVSFDAAANASDDSELWVPLGSDLSRRLTVGAYVVRCSPQWTLTVRWARSDSADGSVDSDVLDDIALDVVFIMRLSERLEELNFRVDETEQALEIARNDSSRLEKSINTLSESQARLALVCGTARDLLLSSTVSVHTADAVAHSISSQWLSDHGVVLVNALESLELWVVDNESETMWTLSADGVRHVAPLKGDVEASGWSIQVEDAIVAQLRRKHERDDCKPKDIELLVTTVQCVLLQLRRQEELHRAAERQRQAARVALARAPRQQQREPAALAGARAFEGDVANGREHPDATRALDRRASDRRDV